jgi:hypothetical protein
MNFYKISFFNTSFNSHIMILSIFIESFKNKMIANINMITFLNSMYVYIEFSFVLIILLKFLNSFNKLLHKT